MPASSWIRIILGLITAAIGTLPLLALLQVIPSRAPAPGDAPDWLGLAIGLAFFLGGVLMVVNGLAGGNDASGELDPSASQPLRTIYKSFGAVIVILLAVIMSWVAFGPGERQFSVSGGSGGAALATHVSGSGQIFGRIAFGLFATIVWIVIGVAIISWARRRFSRR